MKKRFGITILITALLLGACTTDKDRDPDRGTFPGDEGPTAAPTEEPVEPEPTEAPTPTEAEPDPLSGVNGHVFSEREVESFLSGDWNMIPAGELIIDPDEHTDMLTFDTQNKALRYSKGNGASMLFSYTLSELYDELPGTAFILGIQAVSVDGGFCDDEEDRLSLVTSEYRFILRMSSNENWSVDYLLLSDYDALGSVQIPEVVFETGNSVLRNEGVWVFERFNTETAGMSGESDEDLRIKDEVFYAYSWIEFGNSVMLQPVEVVEVESFYGGPATCWACVLPDSADPLCMVDYPYSGKESEAHGGYINPVLYRVRTDSKGEVVVCEAMTPFLYGYYYPYMNGAGDDYRDPDYYGDTDDYFLGEWIGTDGFNTLMISEENVQTGGYRIDLFLYRVAEASGYANITPDGLSINQGWFDAGNLSFYADLERTRDGLRLTVTGSEHSDVEAGSSFDFIRVY
ncbi:MAG: hypothetical protein K6E50_10220 [Lachnospiraceae bacterium]|nr:hypothetical protein [Lachnospiraceae bacterium]